MYIITFSKGGQPTANFGPFDTPEEAKHFLDEELTLNDDCKRYMKIELLISPRRVRS